MRLKKAMNSDGTVPLGTYGKGHEHCAVKWTKPTLHLGIHRWEVAEEDTGDGLASGK